MNCPDDVSDYFIVLQNVLPLTHNIPHVTTLFRFTNIVRQGAAYDRVGGSVLCFPCLAISILLYTFLPCFLLLWTSLLICLEFIVVCYVS